MNFNLRQLVAASAVAMASFNTFAAPIDLGLNPVLEPVVGIATGFGTDTVIYSFMLDSATDYSMLWGDLRAINSAPSAILISLAGPTSASATITPSLTTAEMFSFSNLLDGAYTLSFTATPGNGIGFTAYGGFVTTAAAVPEPESIAMVLAGLGVAGVLARRRKG